jgi:dipeptidyl aminopeptidase/acylaminoacyl peptidase
MYDLSEDKPLPLDKGIHRYLWSPDGSILAYAMPTASPGGSPSGRHSKLFIYKPETAQKHMIVSRPLPNLTLWSWSPSGKYLLLSTVDAEPASRDSGEESQPPSEITKLYVLSCETMQLSEIKNLTSRRVLDGYVFRTELRWLSEDRLMWRHHDRLIATDKDGSNAKEIFKLEKGKFYLYGKEQG